MRLRFEPLETRILMSVTAEVDKSWLLSQQEDQPVLAASAFNADQASLDRYRLGFDKDTIAALGYDRDDPLADTAPLGDATPYGQSYMLYDHWGGTWSDGEKRYSNCMCWAAAASNILDWTGWGDVLGMTNCDQMFDYIQGHWTNYGGQIGFAWDWWFDGTNPSQGWDFWSQVDVPGGGFFPAKNVYNYYRCSFDVGPMALSTIASYLRDGYGVGLGVYTDSGLGHAITCWGYNYNPANPSDYYGIWVTDSDDAVSPSTAPDQLRYYRVTEVSDTWCLQDFWGPTKWYISTVEGLAQRPIAQIQGTVSNDANANGNLDAGETGLANQRIYLDTNQNGRWDHGAVHQDSPKGSKPISDFCITTSTITLSGAGSSLQDINVTIKATHAWDADLGIYLVGPSGTLVILCEHVGGDGNNFSNATFDDEASLSISEGSAPFRGAFRPEDPLSMLDREDPNGTWTLYIIDYGSGDQGKLKSWSIDVTAEEPNVRTDSQGNFVFADLPAGTYRVCHDVARGWSQTTPTAGYRDATLADGSVVSGLTFTDTVGKWVNFNNYAILSYGGTKEDIVGAVTLVDGGVSLSMSGNRWKAIALPYTVTANTVLEFDFQSSCQGEIQGIGLDKNRKRDAAHTFQLYGTEAYGIQTVHNYHASARNWQHYTIPVGRFYTGKMKYLFFANDQDVSNPTVESHFAYVHIYEQGAGNAQVAAVPQPQQNATYAAVVAETLSRLMLDRPGPTATSRPSLPAALLLEVASVRAADAAILGLDDDLAALARARSLGADASL